MSTALRELYHDGGVARFYRGLSFALIMMPLSRFGDIFSNEVAREFLGGNNSNDEEGSAWPAAVVTMVASSMAAGWRILISPADTTKTMMQVHGKEGLKLLRDKVAKSGPGALFDGALGASAASFVGHYPWFVTHNFLENWSVRNGFLDAHLKNQDPLKKNIRRALLGLMVRECYNIIAFEF